MGEQDERSQWEHICEVAETEQSHSGYMVQQRLKEVLQQSDTQI